MRVFAHFFKTKMVYISLNIGTRNTKKKTNIYIYTSQLKSNQNWIEFKQNAYSTHITRLNRSSSRSDTEISFQYWRMRRRGVWLFFNKIHNSKYNGNNNKKTISAIQIHRGEQLVRLASWIIYSVRELNWRSFCIGFFYVF